MKKEKLHGTVLKDDEFRQIMRNEIKQIKAINVEHFHSAELMESLHKKDFE